MSRKIYHKVKLCVRIVTIEVIYMSLGDKLKQLREKKGLKRKDIAELLKTSAVTYGRYEKNERQPDNDTLKKLSDFYQVTIDYFFSDNYHDFLADYEMDYEINYDEDYEMEQYLLNEKNKIERLVKLVTHRMDEIIEGDEPEPGEFEYLRYKLRELFTKFLDNQKLLESIVGYYDVEEDIIEHLKY